MTSLIVRPLQPCLCVLFVGLGTAYLLTYFATEPKHFYMAACLDGLTSCMLSQSQAYITDHHRDGSSLSIELSKFQGLAIGMAFMIGVPLGAIISSKYSIRTPLRFAVGLCALNSVLIPTLLPRAPDPVQCDGMDISLETNNGTCPDTEGLPCSRTSMGMPSATKSINWAAANPFGAAVMLTRTPKLFFGSLAYFLLNVAHCGVQVTWINYLQHKFGMSHAASGSTLMVVGVVVAALPQLVM
jgi:DHA1 family tetracycline resistance protein-like MFS transporter